jgi:hypothetical protein
VEKKFVIRKNKFNLKKMDVINKFYSSVSSTVSQLSGVLPGNPVTREFEASEHISSAGHGKLKIEIFNFDTHYPNDHNHMSTNCTS